MKKKGASMIFTTFCVKIENEEVFKILTKKRMKGINMTKWFYKKVLEEKK